MKEKTLDEEIDKLLKEESAQTKAVTALIDTKKREKGELDSDIELKTDLDEKQICIHSAANMLGHFLEMDETAFTSSNIIKDLVNVKERKLLSKKRLSRKEIVDVAKSPELKMMNEQTGGWVSNLFRKKPKEI